MAITKDEHIGSDVLNSAAIETASRRSSLSRSFSRLAPVIGESSNSKAEHLGKRLAIHLTQFKKLLTLVQTMPSHRERQISYQKLLDALDRSEHSAAKLMEFDDEVAMENGRRRISELRSAIKASMAGYTKSREYKQDPDG